MTALTRRREDLTGVQAVMLDSVRLWVIQMRRGADMEPRITARLGELGASGAAPHLKRFMFALSTGCTRMINVLCTCKPELDADEAAILEVLTLAQELSGVAALRILRRFLTEDGAQTALEAAEAVGEALALAGGFLPSPDHPGFEGAPGISRQAEALASTTLH